MIKQLLFTSSSFALCGCLHLSLTQASPASCPLQAEIGCANELFSARSRTPSATCKPQFGGQTQPASDSRISPNNLKLQGQLEFLGISFECLSLFVFISFYLLCHHLGQKRSRHCQAKDCRFTSRLHLRPQPDLSRFTCLCYGSISIPGIPW